MPTLMLLRINRLTPEERARLPFGCRPIDDKASVVARADVEMPISEIFKLAVAMGRAVPDASFAFHERTAPGADLLTMPAPNWSAPFPALSQEEGADSRLIDDEDVLEAEIIEELSEGEGVASFEERVDRLAAEPELVEQAEESEPTWAELLQAKKMEAALETLLSQEFDQQNRLAVRELLASENNMEVLFACKVARKISWKTLVLPLRNLFRHSSPVIRVEACLAVGELAGPSMSPSVHLLLSDSHPDVQKAARVSLKKLDRRP